MSNVLLLQIVRQEMLTKSFSINFYNRTAHNMALYSCVELHCSVLLSVSQCSDVVLMVMWPKLRALIGLTQKPSRMPPAIYPFFRANQILFVFVFALCINEYILFFL